MLRSKSVRWGNEWGNMPHRFQPIPADLDFAETALESALPSSADLKAKAHNPKVAGSNPAPAISRKPRKCGVFVVKALFLVPPAGPYTGTKFDARGACGCSYDSCGARRGRMPLMLEVAYEESGNSGENLLDTVQPVCTGPRLCDGRRRWLARSPSSRRPLLRAQVLPPALPRRCPSLDLCRNAE